MRRTAAGIALALTMGAAQAAQLVVGQVAPLTGLDASQGKAYAAGIQLAFAAANKGGGINGNTLTLVTKDDAGNPDSTLKLAQELIDRDKAIVLAGFFGIGNIDAVGRSGILDKNQIALVGWRAAQVRPETSNLFNVRASLRDELFKVSEHLGTLGVTKMGIVFEQGPGGIALMTSAGEAAQKSKVTVVAMAGYPARTDSVKPAVDAMIKAQPEAIMMIASSAAAAKFVEQYRGAGGRALLVANDEVDPLQLGAKLSDAQLEGLAIAQAVPSPYKMRRRISKEFADAAAKAGNPEAPVSYAMMEGYITGKVIVEAIKRQGRNPTREGTIAALGKMEYYDLGGYTVSYRPDIRAGSKFVELTILGGKGKVRQ
jgi:ABC-type branched-subunit amino acid transport system substrate-binding protein